MPEIEAGLFIHQDGLMASAGFALLYNWISVIYEKTNWLCSDCFHDQANSLDQKVISCPISVVHKRETLRWQRENTLDYIITI